MNECKNSVANFAKPVKLFVSLDFLKFCQNAGFLFGVTSLENCHITITNIILIENTSDCINITEQYRNINSNVKEYFLGIACERSDAHNFNSLMSKDIGGSTLLLSYEKCSPIRFTCKWMSASNNCDIIVCLFNSKQLLLSSVVINGETSEPTNDTLSFFKRAIDQNETIQEKIKNCLSCNSISLLGENPVSLKNKKSFSLENLLLTSLSKADEISKKLDALTYVSMTTHLLLALFTVCETQCAYINLWRKMIYEKKTRKQRLQLKSLLYKHVTDIVLGIIIILLINRFADIKILADALFMYADQTVLNLRQLLNWLKGAPAGLKLNSQLANFMGEFFLYHTFLWRGYLVFLRSFLEKLLLLVIYSGCLGITIQLSLLQDVLTMMTLHIYCLYVHAARLYHLQVSLLVSLWRLFRGKKWNPLRKRIDSLPHDVDRLFFGTLMFTILFFLLPTTLLFYSVFTFLRLCILFVQRLITQLRTSIIKLSVYFFRPSIVSELYVARVIKVDNCFSILFATKTASLANFEQIVIETNESLKSSYSWFKFVNHLLEGQLIYPWFSVE